MPDNTKLRPATTGTAYGDNITGNIDKLVEKTSYNYDSFNRLKKTETIKDGIRTTAEYIYNGDDLRVSKTVKKSDNGYIAEVTNYLYDRQNVILETDANSNIKARYIKGINYIAKTDAANNLSYFLFNGHGDVVHTVDEVGTLQNQYDYDIWGNPVLTIETTENAIRYSGEFMDSETGLYYLRARYYDPNIGRFISEDSYWGEDENPLSLNLYTYCHNDPVMFTDPSGHSEKGDKNLDKADQKRLKKLGQDYAAAQKKGDTVAMDDAHRAAAALRNSAYDGKYVDTYKYHTKEPNQNPNGCYGIGSSGDTVEKIQTALVGEKYDIGSSKKHLDGIDSTYGIDTKAAVVRYQIDHGLKKYDGIVGEETAKSLGIKLGSENTTTSKGNSDSSKSDDGKITLYDKNGRPQQFENNPYMIATLTGYGGYTTYAPAKSNSNNSIKITFGGKVELPKMQVQTTNGAAITVDPMYIGDATASDS